MVSWKVRSSAFVVLVAVSVSICADFLVLNGARAESPAASTSTVAAQSANSKKSPEQLRQEIAELTKKIEAEPKVAKNYGRRGLRYRDLGELEKALGDFDKALLLDPTDGRVCDFKAGIFRSLGRSRDAIEQLSLAIRLGADSADVRIRRSICYRDLKDYKNALKDAVIATEMRPSDATAWQQLGHLQLEQSDYSASRKSLTEAIRFDPADGASYKLRAKANSSLKLVNEAEADRKMANRLNASRDHLRH